MSIWSSLFGKRSKWQYNPHEHIVSSDVERFGCMDIVQIIRQHVAEFKQSQGMVVVLLEGLRVQIFFFDGIAHASWGYNNEQFSTDAIGQKFLVGSPIVLALSSQANSDSLLPEVVQREFANCDVSIGKLWRLDPTAWDYETMKVMHGNDVGIRISFTGLLAKRIHSE